MDRIPEEVMLHVLSYLPILDLVRLQLVSSRYLTLARDNTLWKTECFNHSRAEGLRRRRQDLANQERKYAELRNAMSALPSASSTAIADKAEGEQSDDIPESQADPTLNAWRQRQRALANWEPGYPNEKIDYYDEFIHRHAPITVDWLKLSRRYTIDKHVVKEATGVALLNDPQDPTVEHIIAPLDDGSICIWDISSSLTEHVGGGGSLLAQSRAGLLSLRPAAATSDSHTIMTDTGAVECVAVNQATRKGYFAVRSHLHEIDLNTLQISSTREYPFPITTLSEASAQTPVTVGTNHTVHLYDPRDQAFGGGALSTTGELIGGSIYSHATLVEPGPLSVIHDAETSIWLAGRFTSLLNYDRRFFPRLRTTVFSGARIACMTALPHPFLTSDLDLIRNTNDTATISARVAAKGGLGSTILAAAEYKGKGSLELYGLPSMEDKYLNRQTASSSKLLSVANHGGRIVFSDGDGMLKWLERDAYSYVRTYNINDGMTAAGTDDGRWLRDGRGMQPGLFADQQGPEDIVQKIVPLGVQAPLTSFPSGNRPDINSSHLLLWTGEGRLGVLGIGKKSPLGEDEWQDALETQGQSIEERAREDAERQYSARMRRALERNADEVRFVRGLGMG